MAYLTKDAYAGKKRYAQRKNEEQGKIAIENGMTEKQTEAITDLCRIRHWLHCNCSKLYNTQCSEYNELTGYIDGGIAEMLSNVGLPSENMAWDYTDLIQDDYMDFVEDRDNDEEMREAYEEAYNSCYDFMSKVNKDIEKYLREIDEKYNTSYAPSGCTRLY